MSGNGNKSTEDRNGGHGNEKGCVDGLLCMLCYQTPSSQSTLVDSQGNPINNFRSSNVATEYREINTLEFREGDTPAKYYLTIPEDIIYGQTIQVDLSGSIFSVKIPDYINKGEKIIIVAPAPVSSSGKA